jgi:hypothetical protein
LLQLASGVVHVEGGDQPKAKSNRYRPLPQLTLRLHERTVTTTRFLSVVELEAELMADAVKVLKDAVPDKRMRSVTVRGFTVTAVP